MDDINTVQPQTPQPELTQPTPALPPHASDSDRTKKIFLLVVVLIVIAAIAVIIVSLSHSKTNPGTNPSPVSNAKSATVKITSTGFEPATLNINANSSVSWTGSDNKPHIIASNPYPADNSLSSLKSQQIASGGSYKYTFKAVGVYHYHDDLNPSLNGTVIVK